MVTMSRVVQDRVRSNVGRTMGIKLDGGINAISLNRDSSQVVAAGRAVFKVFHIEETGFRERMDLRVGRMNLNYSCNDVAWHPIRDELIASGATNGSVITWDLNKNTGNKMDQVFQDHKRTVHKVSFHPTEPHRLFSGSQDGCIKQFDLRTNHCETTFGTCNQNDSIRDLKCIGYHYFTIASTLDNGHIQFWDWRRHDKVLLNFPVHNGPAWNLDWHPEKETQWIATCGRDKMIKVWRWDRSLTQLKPEFTIYGILPICHLKWRPEKKHHIASCSQVLDQTIYIWDIRRSYMPFAVFEEHKDVVTGIEWRQQDPYVFLSGSKDSMLFQHRFKDAKKPAESANPVGVSMSIYDDVCHAFSKSSVRSNTQAPQNYSSSNFPMLFIRQKAEVSDHYEKYESGLLVHENAEIKFSEAFCKTAKRYLLTGKPFPELCEHNAQVATELGRHQIAQTWRMLRLFYTDTSSAPPPVYTNKGIPSSEGTVRTADQEKDLTSSQFSLTHHDFQNPAQPSTLVDSATGVTDDNESLISDSEHDHHPYGAANHGKRRHRSQDGAIDFYYTGDGEEEDEEEEEEDRGVFGYYSNSGELPGWTQEMILPDEAFSQRHEIHERPPSPDQVQDRIQPESPSVPLLDLEPTAITVNSQLFPAARSLNQASSKQLPELQLSIKFTPIVVAMLSDYAEQGDVQMAVSAFIVLDSRIRSEIPIEMQEQWFMSYIDLLSRFKLWCVANEVIKLSKNPNIEILNQESTTMYTYCNRCNKPLDKISWVCMQKDRQSFTNPCSICHLPVKGLYAWCQGCSHGGHLEHIREWLKQSTYCPTGCGHQCEYT